MLYNKDYTNDCNNGNAIYGILMIEITTRSSISVKDAVVRYRF